jgi:hypothetical protein
MFKYEEIDVYSLVTQIQLSNFYWFLHYGHNCSEYFCILYRKSCLLKNVYFVSITSKMDFLSWKRAFCSEAYLQSTRMKNEFASVFFSLLDVYR